MRALNAIALCAVMFVAIYAFGCAVRLIIQTESGWYIPVIVAILIGAVSLVMGGSKPDLGRTDR